MKETPTPKGRTTVAQAISILRTAIAAIAEDIVDRAATSTPREPAAAQKVDRDLLAAAREIATLTEACTILRKRFGRSGL